MLAIVSLLVIVSLSVLVTRVATLALTLTGLSRESARFQARSAFTGVGFTTSESEKVVGHPVRRRILMWLMLIGSAGVVTAVGSLLIAFVDGARGGALLFRLLGLLAGLAVLAWFATSRTVDRWLTRVILSTLRRFTRMDVQDYAGLLRLAGNYTIAEVYAGDEGDWLADRTLASLRLREEGVLCLGIQREDGYEGAPDGDTVIEAGETLVLYGRAASLEDIASRPSGFAGWIRQREAIEAHAAPSAEAPAGEPEAAPGARAPRAVGAVLLLGALGLLAAGCGRTPAAHPAATPKDAQLPACPAPVRTNFVPDRYIRLAEVARSEACPLPRRLDALRSLRTAGPYANLVLPTLDELATSEHALIREEAAATRRALPARPAPRTLRD